MVKVIHTPNQVVLTTFLGLSLTALLGCFGSGGSTIGDTVGGGGIGDTIGGDEHTGEPVKGDYTVSGTWDLSSPLSSDRTLGDVLTDVIVLQLASSIPSDSAVEKIDEVVRPLIKREVDSRAPEVLRPDSELMQSLAGTLASVEVISELHLEDGGLTDDLKGTERIVAFGFEKDGERFQMTPDELLSAQGVDIAADWTAQAESDGRTIEVDRHRFELRFGELVVWLLTNAFDEENDSIAESVAGSIECQAVVTALLGGGDGLFVEIAGTEHGFDAAELAGVCDTALELLESRALGLFALDARVEVGGTVRFIDEDGDGRAERIVSRDGFGGIIGVAPEFIAPRISVQFEGTRLE